MSGLSALSSSSSSSTGDAASMTTTFRSAHRGGQLREIMIRSRELSEYQQNELAPLLTVSDAQSRQIRLIQEALKTNTYELNDALAKQDTEKRTLLEELKGLKQSATELLAQKKMLVKEIRTRRIELEGLLSGRDLYKFALHGVSAALDDEKAMDLSERSLKQSNERAKQLAVMRLARRRDEAKRLLREVEECSRKFRSVYKHVEDLEAHAAVFGGIDGRLGGDHHAMPAAASSDMSSATLGAADGSGTSSLSKKKFWGIRRISTSFRRGRDVADQDATIQGSVHNLNPGESIHVICTCLAEGLLLEDKITHLIDNANSEAMVLAPLASAQAMLATADMKNEPLATIGGLLRECCTLLDENTVQQAQVFRSELFGQSSARECARAVALRVAEAHGKLRAEPTPPGLQMFLE